MRDRGPSGLSTGSTSRSKYCSSHLSSFGRPLFAVEQADALRAQRGQQHVVQAAVLIRNELLRALVDRFELFGNGERIGRHGPGAELLQLLEAGDPDLEELVEVARRDGQELQPLEQRDALVQRLREHPLVELQQGQLTVDVEVRCLEVR